MSHRHPNPADQSKREDDPRSARPVQVKRYARIFRTCCWAPVNDAEIRHGIGLPIAVSPCDDAPMSAAALVVSLLSLVLSAVALSFARRSTDAAESSADTNWIRNAREEKALFDSATARELASLRLVMPSSSELILTNLGPAEATLLSCQSPTVVFSGPTLSGLSLQEGQSLSLAVHGATPTGLFECLVGWRTVAGQFERTFAVARP